MVVGHTNNCNASYSSSNKLVCTDDRQLSEIIKGFVFPKIPGMTMFYK